MLRFEPGPACARQMPYKVEYGSVSIFLCFGFELHPEMLQGLFLASGRLWDYIKCQVNQVDALPAILSGLNVCSKVL